MKRSNPVISVLGIMCGKMLDCMTSAGLHLGALSMTVDDIETVPEGNRPLYVERDGKFHLDVSGIEDTAGLKSALEKERIAAREARQARQALETRFSGIDPDQVRTLLAKIENDDEGKLIAAGKIEEVVAKRNEKFRLEMEKKLAQALEQVSAADAKTAKFSQSVLDNHIRAATSKAGLHPHAIDDALLRARSMFALDENGVAIQLDQTGNPVLGKDGKTPFSPLEWLEGMKESAPHWFPAGSSGGGAGGGSTGAGSAKKMTRAAFAALSPQDKAKTIKTHSIVD